jgi:Heterokaryon incompatibility protein (HET)
MAGQVEQELSEPPSFEHVRLNGLSAIRLVALEAGGDGDPVRCKLMCASLDDKPEYEALSYVWGDPSVTKAIFIDDMLFFVTVNLHAALESLREREPNSPSRIIWNDAICINQRDVLERNHQVHRMGDIYARAVRVIIWLGRYYEPGDSSLTLNGAVFEFDPQRSGTEKSISRAFRFMERIGEGTTERRVRVKDEDLGNIRRLLGRPWFERLWVIQELFNARSAVVVCGRCAIGWEKFVSACNALNRIHSSLPPGIQKLALGEVHPWVLNVYDKHKGIRNRHLLHLLYDLHPIKCTDPRDRVYGLLGITRAGSLQEVDYSASTRDVYINWTWAEINRERTLNVLNFCNASVSDNLPSWVPNIESGISNQYLDPLLQNAIAKAELDPTDSSFEGGTLFAASGQHPCQPEISPNHLHLHLLGGILITKVNFVLNSRPDGIFTASNDPRAVNARKRYGQTSQRYRDILHILQDEIQVEKHFGIIKLSAHPDLWNEFTDVLFRGHGHLEEEVEGEIASLRDRYVVWRGLVPLPSSHGEVKEDPERWRTYVKLVDDFMNILLRNTHIFVTSLGRMGSVVRNCNVQVDDEIWVLFGGSTPYILRKCETGHRLVAPCYLHGFMDGEAIGGWRVGKYKVQDVTLV